MERKQLYWEDVEVGQEIPTGFSLKLDATRMVAQVSGTQDFYPVHHDRDFAKASGVPDAFVNTGFLTAALGRFLCDWVGVEGSLRKFKLEMRRMNLWGDTMTVKGKVTNKYIQGGEHLVDADVWVENETYGVATPCTATVNLPSRA